MSILHVDTEAPALEIWYLDHDPYEAARAVADVHLPKALLDAAVLLSNAWWGHESVETTFGPFGGEALGGGYLAENTAGRAWLHGLEIYCHGYRNKTEMDQWVQRSWANYKWLWRHAMGLADINRMCLKRAAAPAYAVYALEYAPPHLDRSAGATEPPFTRAAKRVYVEEDGVEYVDAVASFRRLYCTAPFRSTLRWSGRPAPSWFVVT